MRRNLLKRRKGMTSLLEMVSSLVIFSLLLVILLRLLGMVSEWTDKTQQSFEVTIDMNYFVDQLQIDLKSATILEVDADKLTVMRDEDVHTYTIAGTKMFRDDEPVLYDIESAMFVPDDGSGTFVGVYVRMANGDFYDLTLSR